MSVTGLQRRDALAWLLLLALTLAVFGQVLAFDFVSWDDPSYVADNGKVARGLSADNLVWAFTTTFFSNWHPLTWLSHMAVVSAWGLSPGAHHGVNLALHAGSAMLCYAFFVLATGDRPRALLIAALFAVHPVHVESVAWVSDRKGLLAAFFIWTTLLGYLRYGRRPGPGRYALVLVTAALAMLSKPTAVILGPLLLLLDFWPLRRPMSSHGVSPGRLLVEKLPLLAMGAAVGVATVYAQAQGGAVVATRELALGDRLLNAVLACGRYALALVWPDERSFFYPYPTAWPVAAVAGSGLALAAALWAAWRCRRQTPAALTGLMWFLLLLLPTLGLLQVGSQAIADRYLYLASVGGFMAVIWSVPSPRPGAPAMRVLAAASVVAVLALAVTAYFAAQAWRNSASLYEHALTIDADHEVAHVMLAQLRIGRGEADAAERHARWVLAHQGGVDAVVVGHVVLGQVLLQRGDLAAALHEFLAARAVKPSAESAYWAGETLLRRGRFRLDRGLVAAGAALAAGVSAGT